MGFKKDLYGIPMIFLEDFFGNSMGSPCGLFGISMVVL
jgi:hypothetical protein